MIDSVMAGARVLHWSGKDLPEGLRDRPAGTYVLEAVDETSALSTEEEQVRQTIDSLLRK